MAGKTAKNAWGAWAGRAARYLRAAPLPHLSSFLSLCAAALCGGAGQEFFERGGDAGGVLLTGMAAGWLAAAGLCQADALSRYREYRRVREVFTRRGYCRRILRAMSGSRCRRDAALLAALETGHRARAVRYFRELGYRRRHVVPDTVAGDPLRLFDRRFLRSTFVPGKKPRVRPGRVRAAAAGETPAGLTGTRP